MEAVCVLFVDYLFQVLFTKYISVANSEAGQNAKKVKVSDTTMMTKAVFLLV